jgi:hypothetical protein
MSEPITESISQEVLFDQRLQERFIRQGLITRKQLEAWKEKLVDVESEGSKIDVGQNK